MPNPKDISKQAFIKLKQAVELHQKGQIRLAQSLYEQVLVLQPKNFDALQLLGTLLAQNNDNATALEYFDKALKINKKLPEIFNNRGLVLMALNKPNEAIESFRYALQLQKNFSQAYANLGKALYSVRNFEQALDCYHVAIALTPHLAEVYNTIGAIQQQLKLYQGALFNFAKAALIDPNFAQVFFNAATVYQQQQNLQAALIHYDEAIRLNSNYLNAYNNKGNVLLELKQHDLAIKSFDAGLLINENAPQLLNNKGNAYKELKDFSAALICYQKALKISPQYADAHNNMGIVLQELKRFGEALVSYNQALQINPNLVDAHNNKGTALRELKQHSEALMSYQTALIINPQFSQAYFNRANTYKEIGQTALAMQNYSKALHLEPLNHAARWGGVLAHIPVFVHTCDQLDSSRLSYRQALIELHKFTFGYSIKEDLIGVSNSFKKAYFAVGIHQPFYLTYQDRNNKDLMQQYAEICHFIMSKWAENSGLTSNHLTAIDTQNGQVNPKTQSNSYPDSKKCKIKLGIVSDQIRYHSVWNSITRGLVEHLNIEEFEVHIFYLGVTSDEQTLWCKSRVASFTQNLPSLEEWSEAIKLANLNAILYPEIGMHALTLQLAHLRLSPVQMVSWGHPETTGIPSIDYFVSAQSFEVLDSQNDYTENLLALPGLGCCYKKLEIKPAFIDISRLKHLSDSNHCALLLCPGNLIKYSPEYDWIFADIAERLGQCKFIFLSKDRHSENFLMSRFKSAFLEIGLKAEDFVTFIPWLKPAEFFGLMHQADIFLDSLGFSGFNTIMQAVECSLPIVTLEGSFMRGRFGSGVLKQLNLSQYCARNPNEYVELCVKLAQSVELRKNVRIQMEKNREILFDDQNPIRAFEQFLKTKQVSSII